MNKFKSSKKVMQRLQHPKSSKIQGLELFIKGQICLNNLRGLRTKNVRGSKLKSSKLNKC